jgi:AcrR family transcriptional regulator
MKRKSSKKKANNQPYPGDLRRDLIDAALATVAENNGAGVLTLRGVARRVGVSHAAPQRHFASKRALLAAVGEQGLREMRSALVAARAAAGPAPLDRLRATAVAYVRFALANSSHFRVMFGPDVGKADSREFQQEAILSFNLLKEIVAECLPAPVEIGRLRQLAVLLISMMHGVAEAALNRQIPPSVPGSVEDLARLAADLLYRSLAAFQ